MYTVGSLGTPQTIQCLDPASNPIAEEEGPMASLNKVMLIGRLTADPEPARTLPNSGNKVVRFRFAVGRSKKNPQTGQWENDPNPLYIDCDAFNSERRKLADLVEQFLRKGSQVYLEGRLIYETWEKDGQKHS